MLFFLWQSKATHAIVFQKIEDRTRRNRIQHPIAMDAASAERTGAGFRPTSNEMAVD
jgi:hypothetical protein